MSTELTQNDMDPDTWLLYQVRERSSADYKRLVEHVKGLPNPIAEQKLSTERGVLVARCPHIAWTGDGGHDYYVETCVTCKRSVVI